MRAARSFIVKRRHSASRSIAQAHSKALSRTAAVISSLFSAESFGTLPASFRAVGRRQVKITTLGHFYLNEDIIAIAGPSVTAPFPRLN